MLDYQDYKAVLRTLSRRLGITPANVEKAFILEPCQYEINFVSTALATDVSVINQFFVQSDQAFVMCELTYIGDSAGDA